MSVTFMAEPGPTTGFTFTCGHEDAETAHRFDDYADAQAFLQAELDARGNTGHLAVCGDDYCAAARMFIIGLEDDPSPEVNVNNGNARTLLGLLGYGNAGLVGDTSAEDFLGRVLIALAVNPPDAGVPPTSTRTEGGNLLIECGRRAGYSEARLAELREVADFAVSRGRRVQWG